MGETGQIIVFICVTLFTGFVQFFTSRKAKPSKDSSAKELEEFKYLRLWGILILASAVVVSPFYIVFKNTKIIPVCIYAVLMIGFGFFLKFKISKVEAKYGEIKKQEEKKEEIVEEVSKKDVFCPECGKKIDHEDYEHLVECQNCGCIVRLDNNEIVKHGKEYKG